ncbi:phosphohydrolase [Desulfoluna sp.]|uniref:phosphohydrolase n=1 Tax=Desulfoluna sp. TaxID=2045199 RepID=UPI00260E993C|nr:phosphohydrolase [Desulfoluna sp.]
MKCPGQDTQYWGAGAIFEAACPDCGATVEFFKDDTLRTCRGCGKRLVNPKLDFGCASYCQFAESCIGSLPPELLAEKRSFIKDRVAVEVKKRCGKDFSRIGRAARLAGHAEHIAAQEEGADLAVLLCGAYLTALSPEERVEVFSTISAPEGLVTEVMAVLEGLSSKDGGSDNQSILQDACEIADEEDRCGGDPLDEVAFQGGLARRLKTAGAEKTARSALVRG